MALESGQWAGVAVGGPLSRQGLEAGAEKPTRGSDEALPFMGVVETTMRGGIPARIARISFSGERAFEVILHVEARASAGDTVLFIVELDYAAIVEIGAIPEEHLQPLILIEVPRLLFPFARAIISNVTRDGGFPPLMISTVDFVEMFRRGVEAESE